MKNKTMKFKAGAYFVWRDELFKVVYIKGTEYGVCSHHANPDNTEILTFFQEEESQMHFISKKKHPEYFL